MFLAKKLQELAANAAIWTTVCGKIFLPGRENTVGKRAKNAVLWRTH